MSAEETDQDDGTELDESDESDESDEGWPVSWLASSPGAVCPACGEAAGRPVVMGLPSPELIDAGISGELDIHFGGCCIMDEDPTHICAACGAGFIDPDAADPDDSRYITGPKRLTRPGPEPL